MSRFRASADRLIRRFGGGTSYTLKRIEYSGGMIDGERAEVVAETVPAEGVVVESNLMKVDGFEIGDKVVILSSSGFSAEQLDGDWKIAGPDGIERKISGPVVAVAPDGVAVDYYAALIKSGAAGSPSPAGSISSEVAR